MVDKNDTLAIKIKNLILSNFPHANINIFFDKEQSEYFISTSNEELYHSEAYGTLVMEIKMNILWKQNIYNFYFILDIRDRIFDNITEKITFLLEDETIYKTWDVNNSSSFVDKHINISDFSLAA